MGATSTNPFDQAAADIFSGQMALGARASVAQVSDRNPDSEAQMQRKAANLGVPADSARAHPDIIDKRTAANAVDYDNLARTAPRTSQFLSSTSNAAIAHDDIGVLGLIEKGFRAFVNPVAALTSGFDALTGRQANATAQDVQKQGGTTPFIHSLLHTNIGDPLKAGIEQLASGALGAADSAERQAEKFDLTAAMQRRLFGGTMESGLASLSRTARRKLDQSVAYTPADTQLGRDIQTGIESIPTSLGALAATVLTGGTASGLAMIGATTFGQGYNQAVDSGASENRATLKGAIDAIIEMGTEYLPEKWFLEDANAGSTLGKMLRDQLKAEVPGEQAATLLQDFNQWALLDRNKGKSFDQYLNEILPHATTTLVATGVGLTATGGAASVPMAAGYVLDRLSRGQRVADDPERAATRGRARSEYASVFDELRSIRRLSDRGAAAEQLQALAEQHAQSKPVLEERHAQALAKLESAKASLDAYDTGTPELKAAREAARSANSAVGTAQSALQAHEYVGQQIHSHIVGLDWQRLVDERRAQNIARRLVQKEITAHQGLHAADVVADLGRLAEASKLRTGPIRKRGQSL